MARTIKNYIKWTILALRMVGLYTEEPDFFKERYYWIYSFIVNVVFLGLYNLSLLLYVVLNFQDIQYILVHDYIVVTFAMCSVKSYIYVKNLPKIRRLIDQLDEEAFQPRNARQTRIFDEFFRAYNVILYLFVAMIVLITSTWPFIRILEHRRFLPFPYWVPFDYSGPVMFELVYLHQYMGLAYFCLGNVALDTICFGLTSYISTACDVLSDNLANMYEVTEERLDKEGGFSFEMDKAERHSKVMENLEGTLMECVGLHWKIIRFAEDVNSFFTVLMFLQFGTSLMSICMTMYGLSLRATSTAELCLHSVFMTGVLTELLYFCYFGQETSSKSVDIGTALYNSPWVDCSKSFKDKVLFFMMRTGKPIRIRALNFFEMALPTFLWITRCSWSFYVVLSHTNTKLIDM